MGPLLLCLAAPPRAAAAPAGWSLLELPGGRSGLLPRLGMAADVPRALVLGEVIRVLHASADRTHPPMAAARGYFAAPNAEGTEPVPVPLPPEALRGLLGRDVSDAQLLGTLLQDRRASLVCYGLLGMDAVTRDRITSDRGLLRRLYDRHSGALAAFGGVIVVNDGRLLLPGGPDRVGVWEALLGESLAVADRALTTLLTKDDGRLAYFVETVASLDEGQLALVFGVDPAPEAMTRHARAVYATFVNVEPAWRPNDFPFLRITLDPAVLLTTFRPSPDGRLRKARRFWAAVLADEPLPADVPEGWTLADAGPRVHPSWLLRELTEPILPARQARALVYHFASRSIDRLPDLPAGEIIWMSRAFRHYPALLLALERVDVRDPVVVRRLVQRAGQAVGPDRDAAEITLALYQAPIALAGRLVQAHALSSEAAQRVLASFADLDPAAGYYGRAVADWIEKTLLPAVGYDESLEAAITEGALLEALAGLRAPADAAVADAVTWEAYTYRVDAAAPELQRLTELRTRQGGNTLDTALALCRIGRGLAEAKDLAAVPSLHAALAAVREQLQPIEAGERRGAADPVPVESLVDEAQNGLSRIRSPGDLKRLAGISMRLSRAGDAVLADALTSIVYALWLGDPQGQVFLAGNVARRHNYGLVTQSVSERQTTPWTVPSEHSGTGDPWHVRGSLLGLDVGLARLRLRRTRMDLPDENPTLNESDRLTFVLTLALTEPTALDQADGERLVRWLKAGRAVAATPEVSNHLGDLALGGRRRQAILWAVEAAPDEVVELLLLTELVRLGRDANAAAPHAWGVADTVMTGALRLRFPDPPALHRYAGRSGSGLMSMRIADLKLRVLELIVDHRLPVVLAPAVLDSATQDFLDQARPAHSDDWHALLRAVRQLPEAHFEDYVAALTAGGPLVPVAAPAPAANGHR